MDPFVVRAWCAANPRSFVLFDPLELMAERWGDDTARRLFRAAQAATRVGAALRNVRAERNITQAELARTAGISPSAISLRKLFGWQRCGS